MTRPLPSICPILIGALRAVSFACLLLVAPAPGAARGSPIAEPAAIEESVTDELVARGFESVCVHASPERVTVWYENRIHRYELRALGVVAGIASARADSASLLEIIPETRGVALISLTARCADWGRFLDGRADARWFGERLEIRSDGGLSASRRERAGLAESNNSRWKVDVAARPLLDLEFGIPGDPLRLSAWVAPEATVSPARGMLFTAQAIIRLRDEIDTFARPVAPGRTTLSAAGWLPGACLGALSAGYFSDNRYGFAGEAGRLLFNGALECRVGGDFSGYLKFSEGVTLYSSMAAWSAFAALTHRAPLIDVETTVTAGRFMHGDAGVRVDVARRFHETEFGFFGVNTETDRLVGFRMSLPLPVERSGPPARLRAVTVPAFPWEYRESVSLAGLRVKLYDNTARFRKGLYPTFVRNNLEDLRAETAAKREGGAS